MADERVLTSWAGQVRAILPGHEVRIGGPARPDGPWRSLRELADPTGWPDMARAYARGLGSTVEPMGASCALQGLSARVVGPLIAGWAVQRAVPVHDPEAFWVRVVEGRSTAVSLSTGTSLIEVDDPAELATVVVERIKPLVGAVRASSPVLERVLWGNVGAACAGAWRLAHLAERDGPLDHAVRIFFAAPVWPHPPAIRCETWPDFAGTGAVLVHHRETCCLIHLAPDHAKCPPCSKLSVDERRRRWTERIVDSPGAAS